MNFFRIYLIIIFIAFSLFYFWKSFLFPHGMLDAWAIWNVKGKIYALSFLEGLPFNFIISHAQHPGYPIFMPLSLTFWAIIYGEWSFILPIFYNYLHFLIYFYMIYRFSIHRNFSGKIISVILLFCAFFAPGILLIITDQCADFPIGTNIAVLFFLLIEIRDKRINPVKGFYFAGLCFGVILNTKMEGSIIVPILMPFFLYHTRGYLNRLNIFTLAAGFFLYLCLFLVYKFNAPELNPVPVTINHITNSLISLERYINVIKHFLLLHASIFLICPIIISHLLIKKINLELFIPLALLHIAYSGIFIITSSDQVWHLETAYSRIHLQLFPAFSLVGIYLLSSDKNK